MPETRRDLANPFTAIYGLNHNLLTYHTAISKVLLLFLQVPLLLQEMRFFSTTTAAIVVTATVVTTSLVIRQMVLILPTLCLPLLLQLMLPKVALLPIDLFP